MSMRLAHSCFVHIPRTGGLWFKQLIKTLEIKNQILTGDIDSHLPFQVLPANWKRLKGFSFVRHPYAWLKSRWSHALQYNVVEDFRHYGVHRLFDSCVKPSFADTIETVLEKQSGLVGHTYKKMTLGCERVYRTESLPLVAYELLEEFEGFSNREAFTKACKPAINSTSQDPRWKDEIDSVPKELVEQFVASEKEALEIWNGAF